MKNNYYIRLDTHDLVAEHIPEYIPSDSENEEDQGIHASERYAFEFLAQCILYEVTDETPLPEIGRYYDRETEAFTDPPSHNHDLPLEEAQRTKNKTLNESAQATITAGIDVTTSRGEVHFSLTPNDQTNIMALGAQAESAPEGYCFPYHSDGDLCRLYSRDDILLIVQKAMEHVAYHTTYCNILHVMVKCAATSDEVNGIYYGMNLPQKYASHMQYILTNGAQGEEYHD